MDQFLTNKNKQTKTKETPRKFVRAA